jgi:hypothetical protein
MLPAQKENEPASRDLRSTVWTRVMGSLEGLRHKLDDLTTSNIDEAQEKVKTLSLRLSELQRALEGLLAIREQLVKVEATKAEVDGKTPGITELENIQVSLQLHTLGQLRNLIRVPRVNRVAAEVQGSSAKGGVETDGQPQGNKQRADLDLSIRLSPHAQVDQGNIPTPLRNPTDLPVAYGWRQSRVDANEYEVTAEQRPQAEQRAASNVDNLLSAEEMALQARPSPQEDPPASASIPVEDKPAVTDAMAAKVDRQDKADAGPVIASPSQAGSGFEFDQRLLNDLIKDYGEFVIPSPPPKKNQEPVAPLEATESSEAKTEAEFPLVENVTVQKTLPTASQEDELDRKLKKLIKDYGEYDLYSDHTSKKYRAGAVAAFTILGVILAGIYFFSPAQNDTSTNSSTVIRRDSPTGADQPSKRDARIETGSKPATGLQRDVPEQSDVNGLTEFGNKAAASKNKNNEKVGR